MKANSENITVGAPINTSFASVIVNEKYITSLDLERWTPNKASKIYLTQSYLLTHKCECVQLASQMSQLLWNRASVETVQ